MNASSPVGRRNVPGQMIMLVLSAASLLAGCNAQTEQKPATPGTVSSADAYDVSKMDFKPSPAQLSGERHTGAFSTGSALSNDAAVKPLVADPVKEIHIDTTHKIIEIAPGVKFSAWTFGDQVPGPIVRARVGSGCGCSS